MTTKDFAKIWNISSSTVLKYCNKGLIPDCKKNGNVWDIPEGSIKPLSEKDIRRLLLVSVKVKNNPNLECDWSTFNFRVEDIKKVYESLVYRKYIKDISDISTKRIPYELVFTDKGFELIDSITTEDKVDFTKLISTVVNILGTVIPALIK